MDIIIIINIVHEVHNKEKKERERETVNNRTYKLGEFHTIMSLNTKIFNGRTDVFMTNSVICQRTELAVYLVPLLVHVLDQHSNRH